MMVMLRVAVPVAPCESFAVRVITCDPTDRVDVENDVPVPIWPSMLLVHLSDDPESVPSSRSLPVPTNETLAPITKVALTGDEIDAIGA